MIFIKKSFISLIIFLILPLSVYSQDKSIAKGVWVTSFSKSKPFYSKRSAVELVKFCKKKGINEIYLQMYRSGLSYYDTKMNTRKEYEAILKSAGEDPIDVILAEAKRCNIKVFSWVNILSVGKTRDVDIVKKLGDSILTLDQYLHSPMRTEHITDLDKYYLRDEQLFLEPGDPKVGEYIKAIIDEIVTRYPGLSGMHLDYVRYPHPIPYIPRTSFNKFGLTYGYGEENIKRFKEKTGLDPMKMNYNNENSLIWDNWKREQVTNLVGMLSGHVKSRYPAMIVSCAVLPSPEAAYLAAFQDWPGWLEKGIVDYAVTMNYTKNTEYAVQVSKSGLSQRGKGKLYIGIGNFLMKDDPAALSEQVNRIESLNPDGIAYFSYDFL